MINSSCFPYHSASFLAVSFGADEVPYMTKIASSDEDSEEYDKRELPMVSIRQNQMIEELRDIKVSCIPTTG